MRPEGHRATKRYDHPPQRQPTKIADRLQEGLNRIIDTSSEIKVTTPDSL